MPRALHPLLADILSAAHLPAADAAHEGRVRLGGTDYFLKTSRSAHDAAQVRGEAAALAAMALSVAGATGGETETGTGIVPRIVGYRERDGVVALATTYAGGWGGSMRALGEGLAKMHRAPPESADSSGEGGAQATATATATAPPTTYTGRYGFPVPTFCGATEQDNTWTDSWEEFYCDRRLGDIVRRIGDSRVDQLWARMKERAVPLLLRNFTPAPVPVPLHGDLWPGNVAADNAGRPVIYDPAGYYGHGEADLGMTRMFGGFSREFYDAYHGINPRSEPYYDERIRLYELYHHLNHALMFGGSYVSSSVRIMRELCVWAEGVGDGDRPRL